MLLAMVLAQVLQTTEPPDGASRPPHSPQPTAHGPLSLPDAVRGALARQPRLKAVADQRDAAEARRDQARLDRLGKLEAALLYTPWQKPLEVTFPGVPPLIPAASFEIRTLRNWSLQESWTQPLFTWGALEHRARGAGVELEAADLQVARARQQTAFEATRAFLQAAQAEEAVKVASQALEQQQAFLQSAEARVRAGASARLDALKAELGVAQAQSALVEARHGAGLAREALASLTLDPRFRSEPLASPEPDSAAPVDEEAAVRRALESRSDLHALRRQSLALDHASRAARGSGLPALSFRATAVQQNDAFGSLTRKEGQQYAAGFALSWETFSPFRSRAKAAELKAASRALSHQAEAAEESVALEVRSAARALQEARERLSVQARAVAVAEEQARIARLAYKEGVLTAVDLQQAELGLSDARYRRLKASLDSALAQAGVRFAVGD